MKTLVKDYNDITRIVRNIDLSEKRAQKAMGEKHSQCVELSEVMPKSRLKNSAVRHT